VPRASNAGGLRRRVFVLLLGGVTSLAPWANATQLVGDAAVSHNGNAATVHWATDVATGTRLKISPDAIVHLPADRTPTTDHVVSIEGLQPGKNYTIQFGTARLWLGTRDLSSSDGKVTPAAPTLPTSLKVPPTETAPPTEKMWGNVASLPDHFARHGSDFHARDQDDYARMAWEFLQRAKAEGLPAKVDPTGTLRVFDPKSGTFAAYNRNGTAKTFFKPGSPGYFDRQPGREVNLKTWR
jgi:pyocin large subunit-like protein